MASYSTDELVLLMRRMKYERLTKFVSQGDLGERLDRSQDTISNWERAHDNGNCPSEDLVPAIAKALKLTVADFTDLEKIPSLGAITAAEVEFNSRRRSRRSRRIKP